MKSVWALQIDREALGDVLVLVLRGRLGAASADPLRDAVAGAVDGNGAPPAILVDLEGVDYMSGTGLVALDAAVRRIRAAGGRLALSGACDPVRLVLDFGGLLADVPIEPSRAAGLERLRRGR